MLLTLNYSQHAFTPLKVQSKRLWTKAQSICVAKCNRIWISYFELFHRKKGFAAAGRLFILHRVVWLEEVDTKESNSIVYHRINNFIQPHTDTHQQRQETLLIYKRLILFKFMFQFCCYCFILLLFFNFVLKLKITSQLLTLFKLFYLGLCTKIQHVVYLFNIRITAINQ